MNGSKPLTALQRETLQFLREKAAEWIAEYSLERIDHGNAVQLGKALGAAEAICVALCQAVPPEKKS